MKKIIAAAVAFCALSVHASAENAQPFELASVFSAPPFSGGAVFLIGGAGLLLILLLAGLLVAERRRSRRSRQMIEKFDILRKNFMDATDDLVCLKDENLNYLFVNKAFAHAHSRAEADIIGKDDFALVERDTARKRREADLAAIRDRARTVQEDEWAGRIYRATKFPISLFSGQVGVGAYITDITPERERERRQRKVLQRHKILTDFLTRKFQSRQEQLDYALHEALKLTESRYAYLCFYDEKAFQFTLNAWTSSVMADCAVKQPPPVCHLADSGLWGEVVRQRKPIVFNHFDQTDALKKEFPNSHVQFQKYMSFPIMIDGKITAIAGFANKLRDYDETDVYETMLLMSGIWNSIQRKETQDKLSFERNKYLQTLISIGDGVMVVDKDGRVEMLNGIAERLTGWSLSEAVGIPYGQVFVLEGERGAPPLKDCIAEVFTSGKIQEMENHITLVSRTGARHVLEDSAAPIRDDSGATVGVVLVFRDVTDRKKQQREIEYLSFHDSLTGLYNRRFFEEELQRLNTTRNLPISVIMGDVNGLKLTNDIFGHAWGDLLLQKLSQVMKRVCRADDIIARWGGDEFVVLLPKTGLSEAQQIMERIRTEFSKEQIKALSGSVSLGANTVQTLSENIMEALNRAEEKMYLAKTLERSRFKSCAINTIIRTLHESSAGERRHSANVRNLCADMGRLLALPAVELKKLTHAGYLHDIGKIVLAPKLLHRQTQLTDKEEAEIRKHPTIGYRILNFFDDTLDLAEIVLAHHEHWDGSGYPKGLKGEEIPLSARIISIAEVYDRVLYEVSDSEPGSRDDALQVILQKAGKNFDPALVRLFAQMLSSVKEPQQERRPV